MSKVRFDCIIGMVEVVQNPYDLHLQRLILSLRMPWCLSKRRRFSRASFFRTHYTTFAQKKDLAKLRKDGRLRRTAVLEIDGMELVQSNSILRYVARRNLYPSSIKEQYVVDVICDNVNTEKFSDRFSIPRVGGETEGRCSRVVPRYIAAFERRARINKFL